ncbi:MAG: hypothetical protein JSV22_13005 [Bacteroidales bacterium]|nr:MAG: hypothetical protein JSV22_13005 [Bacteroidales bacterium]
MDFERVVRLKTGEVTDITTNSAIVSGFFRDLGEGGITQYGHCWSVNQYPTIFIETRTEYDRGGWSIYSIMDSLLPGTTYYVRAYALYRGEEIYGDNVPFTTNEASLPTLSTESLSNITDSTATCGGEITDNGGALVTARGVCWNTTGNPTLSDSYTTDGSSTGEFTSNVTGLSPNTTYYIRAYATTSAGTGYGNELIFTTLFKMCWQKCFGGSGKEEAYSIQQTTDGGYIIAGISHSSDGDVTSNYGYADCWILKLTSTGEINWKKSLGGSGYDRAYSIQQTNDEGYIFAASTGSDDYDVTGNKGYSDYWIVKLSSTGDIDWEKCHGGQHSEFAYSIQQTTDSGYIVAGTCYDNGGDVTGNHGYEDYWIVKLTSTGELVWQKSLGGSSFDFAREVRQTSDGGYIIAGYSNSNDGDVTGNHGDYDYWIVKLTSTGQLDWQKSLGGSESDKAYSVQQTTDGGYIIAGFSYSSDGDVTGLHDFYDYWIVKLTSAGEIDWQKCFGGKYSEETYSIQQTADQGYIVAGFTRSSDGDVSEKSGESDYWIVKLNSAGEIIWQKSMGGSDYDVAWSIQQTTDGGYIIAGYSESEDGHVSGNNGGHDFWIVRLCDD